MAETRRAPLAGRPPFATDEPDSIYDEPEPAPRRRMRQPKPENNRPESTYDVCVPLHASLLAYNLTDLFLTGMITISTTAPAASLGSAPLGRAC